MCSCCFVTTCWLQKQPFTVIDVGQLTLAVAYYSMGGSVAEWLVSWTRDAIGPGFKSAVTLSVNNLGQTVHTHRASVHQAAKLVAALLRVVWVTAGVVENNNSLLLGLWLTSPADWLPRTGISSGTLRSVIEYGLPLPFYYSTVLLNFRIHYWSVLENCQSAGLLVDCHYFHTHEACVDMEIL